MSVGFVAKCMQFEIILDNSRFYLRFRSFDRNISDLL